MKDTETDTRREGETERLRSGGPEEERRRGDRKRDKLSTERNTVGLGEGILLPMLVRE